MSLRQCFDRRVPDLTLVWEPVSFMDPLKYNQQGTAMSCLATKYDFEQFFLFCFGCGFFFLNQQNLSQTILILLEISTQG